MIDYPFKLGKTEAIADSVKLKFANYVDKSLLPKPPKNVGHENIVPNWQMLGNDQYGCCVWSGAAHETEMWNNMGGNSAPFSTVSVLNDYADCTGFDPSDPSTDKGTNIQVAASYRRKVGVLDANGNRHKVGAYLEIKAGDVQEHLLALWLFGAVGVGLNMQESAMQQFNDGLYWSYDSKSPYVGGHYVPIVARRGIHFECVTWGRLQKMTDRFFKANNDESVVYLSEEMLLDGKTDDGFDLASLQADLNALK
jgi:hypothetical protein